MRLRSTIVGATVAILASLTLTAGCHARRASLGNAAERAVAASLDSCGRGYGTRETAPPTTPSSARTTQGWAVSSRRFQAFSLLIPDSAAVAVFATPTGSVDLRWRKCAGCRFSVALQSDSGVGIDARIAQLVAEQRRIDSANKNPHAEAFEFNEIDGPPVRIPTSVGQGYLITRDCGDCAAMEAQFAHAGRFATISFGGDDDVPELGRYLCEMEVVAKTFNWQP